MKFLSFDIKVTKKFVLIWSLIMAFTLAFFFTSNSPFFKYDTWADSSVYTQVGHNWLVHGMIPYKDLFDHKGPLHFLLFGIGSLLRVGNSYIGIYIIEALFMSISIYYYYKTINLYIKSRKISLIVATLAQLVMFTTVNNLIPESTTFKNVLILEKGGSPEEFCIPFISILLYICAKVSISKRVQLTRTQWVAFGLSCAAIFLEKFTISFPFILLLFTSFVWIIFKQKDQIKNAIIFGLSSLFIPIILMFLYFKLNGAFSDFINYYFKVNLFNYNFGGQTPLSFTLFDVMIIGIKMLKTNYLLFIGFFAGVAGLLLTSKQTMFGRLLFAYILISVYVISLFPDREYPHYLLPIIPVALTGFAFLIPESLKKSKLDGYLLKLVFSFIVVILISISSANEQMNNSKIRIGDNMTSQEVMADIIKHSKGFNENKTNVLVLFSNNTMIHTLTNTIPKTRFFYRPAMEIPAYNKEILSALKHKKPKYLVGFHNYGGRSYTPELEPYMSILQYIPGDDLIHKYWNALQNYKLIYKWDNQNEIDRRVDYLFERK